MDSSQDELRDYIRARLGDKGWEIKRLASEARLGESTLYGFLSGGKRAGYELLMKVARALGEMPSTLYDLGGLESTETLDDEEAEREIRDLVARMDRERRRLAIRLLHALADEVNGSGTARPGQPETRARKAAAKGRAAPGG